MVTAKGRAALDALPADTQNLAALLESPADVKALARFTALRQLLLGTQAFVPGPAAAGPSPPDPWRSPPLDVLAGLAALPALEDLTLGPLELPGELPLRAAHLAPLRELPALRALQLTGCTGTPELAAALVALPRVRELRFTNATLDADFVERLRPLGLERLTLWYCPQFDARAQRAIAALGTLRSLEIHALERTDTKWMPIDRDAFAAICALPSLRELSFGTEGGEEPLLALLPPSLTRLDLHTWLDAAAIAGLRRLANLRDVTLNPRDPDAADALAGLVDALRLQRFTTGAQVTPKLVEALGRQPDLTNVELRLHQAIDLAPLARAPRLRELTLSGYGAFKLPSDYTPTLADVQPLAGCAALRKLRLINCGLGSAEVQAALGKQVSVEVEELL
jgi:hypothetical protein